MVSIGDIEQRIRQVPNFPKPGINFLDMSPILENKKLFSGLIEHMTRAVQHLSIDKVIAIESRGFILGAGMARDLNAGFVMVRKKGKLPGTTVSVTYDLEYGTDCLEILPQSIKTGDRVLIVDDVLATGGTAAAAAQLCDKLGAQVMGLSCFMEIGFLNGRNRFPHPVYSLIQR